MDHHWSIDLALVLIVTSVFKVESLRKLEVELNGSALISTLKRILDGNVYLRAIEGTVARINIPFARLEAL
jgi:SHS2 domain-containing protein